MNVIKTSTQASKDEKSHQKFKNLLKKQNYSLVNNDETKPLLQMINNIIMF